MNISPFTTVSIVDTSSGGAKTLNLPYSILVLNKTITIKDKGGRAADSNITINTYSNDRFQDGSSNYIINTNYGAVSFLALSNIWCIVGTANVNNDEIRLISSIVSYGLSTIATEPHDSISSISSILSYGLSTVAGAPHYGVSSLSSIVSYGLSTVAAGAVNPGVSSLSSIISYGLSTIAAQANDGVSSLSSIISYGLSTIAGEPHYGTSSLSSIFSYGLSTVYSPYGVSSLSSIISYGLSTVAAQANNGTSSLSSIISYGLSTIWNNLITSNTNTNLNFISLSSIISYGLSSVNITVTCNVSNYYPGSLQYDGSVITNIGTTIYSNVTYNNSIISNVSNTYIDNTATGLSSLSSIVSYGLSTVYSPYGVSSLSSIISYGLSTVAAGSINPGVSSLSSIISYGLSTVAAGSINPGVSSLSSIISYGLSTVAAGSINPGVSSLSSIVSYGLSTVYSPYGISSLSSIVSYGLSSLRSPYGVSSLSSIVSYGLSSLQSPYGVSSLSSIVSYGLSSLRSPYGVSSLSSIVSYGLSTVYSPYGISSLSSIVSYGLSTVYSPYGISSLSSIISYGLSTIAAQPQYGVSSLSSIVSYGLSTVAAQPNNGVSTLSTIVYGFSNSFTTNNLFVLSNAGIRCNTPSYALDVNGSIQGQLASNSFNKDFSASDLGGTGIRDARYNTNVDTYVDSMFKMDSWIFNNIVGKPPAPRFISSNLTKQYIAVSWSNPILYSIGLLNTYVPHITNLLITLSNVTVPGDTIYTSPIVNISAQSNLPMYGTAIQGVQIYNAGTSNSIITVSGINYKQTVNTSISPTNTYNMYISFSNFNLNENIPINTLTVPNLSLLAAGVPSAPINLASSATLYTITITWSAPLSNDITDPNAIANGVSILNYRLAWSNIVDSTRPRRYTAGRDINTYNPITITPSPLSYQITGLWPDSLYNISLSARNQLNTNYGQHITSASDILTGLHAAGDLIVTNNLSNYSPNQPTYAFSNRGSPANSRPGTSLIILNSNTIRTRQGLSFEYSNVAIQTASSPGISVPGDIMRIIGSNNSNSSVFLSNGGWTDSGDRSVSSCNMTISRTNVTDVYSSGCNTGFFQKATYRFTISNALLMPSQSPYTFFLTQSNFNNQFRTQMNNSIYVDTINGPPSINAIYHNSFFNPPDPTVYICGVFSYANGVIFNNYLDMNNLGTYYLAQGTNGEFVTYYISIGSTPCGASNYGKGTDATPSIFNTGNTPYSSGILPNPARIQTSVTLNDPTNTTFTSSTNNLSLTARPVNLCNIGALTTNTLLYDSKTFYVDLPSIFVMSQTNSALNVRGVRVMANGESTIPNLANIGTFNNNASLMNGSYFYELQLVNGYYSTSNYSIDAYRNYFNYYYYNSYNYSSPGTGTRYVMLLYSNTTNNINSIEKIKFQFTYAPGGAFPIRAFDTQFSRFESNITLQYKFISALATTGWLNGNSNIDSFNSPASNYVNNGISGLNNSTFGTSPTVRSLQIPSGNHNGFQVYIRIGIPMTLPCAFSYLTYIGAE